jgi:hypothetical protein
MPHSRYRKRQCARCGIPVKQPIEEILEGKKPLCSQHALEESIERMNEVISSLHASIARQTIALLRECGVYIPDDAAEHVIEQLRAAPRDDGTSMARCL